MATPSEESFLDCDEGTRQASPAAAGQLTMTHQDLDVLEEIFCTAEHMSSGHDHRSKGKGQVRPCPDSRRFHMTRTPKEFAHECFRVCDGGGEGRGRRMAGWAGVWVWSAFSAQHGPSHTYVMMHFPHKNSQWTVTCLRCDCDAVMRLQ